MPLPYDIDTGAARRAALGLIVLQMDETIEADFRRLIPADGIYLYQSRIPSEPEVTPETLSRMGKTLPAAAALLPAAAALDVVGYACTSAATLLGEAAVERLVCGPHPGVRVTNPFTALKAACRVLGVKRLGLVSPYVAEVSDALRAALADGGVAVTAFGSFDQKEERLVTRIAPESVLAALLVVGGGDCEAVFASCTNLRATEVVTEAERKLGKPVLASNQVLAWHMLRLAGIDDEIREAGALFRMKLDDIGPG